jgi:hypothetical protein
MDIIAAHQQGLIDQLDDEVAALAGCPRDHVQRAIALHHLYDHSRGGHAWALAEARRALWVAGSLAALGRRIERWGWLVGGREEARAALALLAESLGEAAQRRAATAYRAYRLTATAALRNAAEEAIEPLLLELLDQCHSARRSGSDLCGDAKQMLAGASEQLATAVAETEAIKAAWSAIDATSLRRAARRLLGDKAIARQAARDERRGWVKVERRLLADPALPAAFRANPAQHFYALQRLLQQRRRQRWREACDREPDAFGLAA